MQRDGVFTRSDRPGFYVSYIDAAGKRCKEKVVASTRKQALNVLEAIKTRVQQERILGVKQVSDISTADLFARFLKYQKAHVTARTIERETGILAKLTPLLPARAKDVDRATLAKLIAESTAAPATIHKETTLLKHVFRLAVEWDLLQSNPAERLKLPRVVEARTRYLSPSELKLALDQAEEWMRPILALAAFTGMRRGELLSLKWVDVDLAGRRAYLHNTKNGSLRVVPLNELAMQVITSLPQRHALLFGEVDEYRLSVATTRLFRRLGIADASFHTLRHTAASWLTMQGVDLYAVGQVLGHKTPRMTARYSHLSPAYVANAVSALDTALAGTFGDAVGTINPPQRATTHYDRLRTKNAKSRVIAERIMPKRLHSTT